MEEIMTDLQQKELAFLGRVTAGFTHEVKNILAIIKENVGLMEDILSMIPADSFSSHGRFSRVIYSIREQSDRGVELSNHLNRFAHTTDHLKATIDLILAVEQLSQLARRFARLKEVTVTVDPSPEGQRIVIETSPVCLQMALFNALECCWNAMTSGGTIALAMTNEGGEARISFACQCALGPGAEFMERIALGRDWPELGETVQSLGGRLHMSDSNDGFIILLPRKE